MSATNTMVRLTGVAAIEAAESMGLLLGKYADPTEGAREGLTVSEAREVAAEDSGLVYLDVPAADGLTVVVLHGTMSVRDSAGGVWHPSDEATEEIEQSESPAATALRICREQPMRGEWQG